MCNVTSVINKNIQYMNQKSSCCR